MTQWKPKLIQDEQSGIPDLFPTETPAEGPRGSDPWMYYARRATHPTEPGWIFPRETTPNYRAKYMKAGWVPLDQFGTFVYGLWGNIAVQDVAGVHFDSSRENYRVFFQKNGAEHMPVDQVIAFGWHLDPPYKQITFPQLEGLEIPVFQCLDCNHAPFAASAHLRIHLLSTHNYSRTELNVYAEEAGLTWSRRHGDREIAPEAPVLPMPAIDLTPTTPTAMSCSECDFVTKSSSKRPKSSLRMHMRTHASPEPELVAVGVSEETTQGGSTPIS